MTLLNLVLFSGPLFLANVTGLMPNSTSSSTQRLWFAFQSVSKRPQCVHKLDISISQNIRVESGLYCYVIMNVCALQTEFLLLYLVKSSCCKITNTSSLKKPQAPRTVIFFTAFCRQSITQSWSATAWHGSCSALIF